jgi:ATP-binding cassette subfamily C protein LapB
MNVTDEGRSYDLEMKRMTDQSQYMVALFQQSSFILMVKQYKGHINNQVGCNC